MASEMGHIKSKLQCRFIHRQKRKFGKSIYIYEKGRQMQGLQWPQEDRESNGRGSRSIGKVS